MYKWVFNLFYSFSFSFKKDIVKYTVVLSKKRKYYNTVFLIMSITT